MTCIRCHDDTCIKWHDDKGIKWHDDVCTRWRVSDDMMTSVLNDMMTYICMRWHDDLHIRWLNGICVRQWALSQVPWTDRRDLGDCSWSPVRPMELNYATWLITSNHLADNPTLTSTPFHGSPPNKPREGHTVTWLRWQSRWQSRWL